MVRQNAIPIAAPRLPVVPDSVQNRLAHRSYKDSTRIAEIYLALRRRSKPAFKMNCVAGLLHDTFETLI